MAKSLDNASGLTLTAGTPAYMAPEQARGVGSTLGQMSTGSPRSAYALITGHPPFPDDRGVSEVAFRDPNARPAPVGVPTVDAVLGRALAYDRDQRPPTAGLISPTSWPRAWWLSTRCRSPKPDDRACESVNSSC